jgi:hypothetical protein
MADGDHDLEIQAADLADHVVELRLAFGLQHGLVEVEERVRGEGDLLARRGRGRRRRRRGRAAGRRRRRRGGGGGGG